MLISLTEDCYQAMRKTAGTDERREKAERGSTVFYPAIS
jgi:hypothetical protein